MTQYYKVLGLEREAIHGGRGTWPEVGVWAKPVRGRIEACVNGYHLTTREHLLGWRAPEIAVYEADGRGDVDDHDNKIAVREARLTRLVGTMDARKWRLFAADCAEHVLHLFEQRRPDDERPRRAIETARRYARGEATADELHEVYTHARSADATAYAAAYAAYAADATAYAAAAAAYAAAAYAAAYAAAAARKREWAWQLDRFFAYLEDRAE